MNLTLVRATIMSSVRRTILAPGRVKNQISIQTFFTLYQSKSLRLESLQKSAVEPFFKVDSSRWNSH